MAHGTHLELDYDPANCAVGAAVAIIGERATFLVLRERNGVRRFADMQHRTGSPGQALSDRLARLVQQGLLRKVPYQDSGQRSRDEYRLTGKGLDLYPVLVGPTQRATSTRPGRTSSRRRVRHRDCGSRCTCSCPARPGMSWNPRVTSTPSPARAPARSPDCG